MHIQAQCPLLQDLAVPVKRTKSDGLEVEMYKSFGKIERLQSLYLTLDCSDWRVTRDSTLTDDPSFDEDDRRFFAASRWKKGYLREAFMNCAVDESLARSIWDTICRVKEGKQLESLKLFTTGGGNFGNTSGYSDMSDFIDHLSRSWLIRRSVRDDESKITVRELGRQAREARDRNSKDLFARRRASPDLSSSRGNSVFSDRSAVHIFRRVWSPNEDSEDWREDWASLPLQS